MGYAPVSKVLSTYTRVEELALPLAQPEVELVIHRGQPRVGHHPRHRHRHRVRHEWVVVLDLLVVAQNQVARREVSPMTIAEYKIMRKWVKKMKFLYCVRKKIINRVPSGNHNLTKIGQSLLCTRRSTQNTTCTKKLTNKSQ